MNWWQWCVVLSVAGFWVVVILATFAAVRKSDG